MPVELSDHRLVHPTIRTRDDVADRSPSESDSVLDLGFQRCLQLLSVLHHPLAPIFASSHSHHLVIHEGSHLLSVEGVIA